MLGFDKSPDVVEHGEMLKYFEFINYYASTKGFTMMLWDNGCHMDRTNCIWKDQSLYNMLEASWKTRSPYSESDRVFIKDADKDKDVAIKLVLNENDLKSVYNGKKKLEPGADYTYADGTVTIKKEYISKVITENYGIDATLTLKFSHGADWDVYLTHYSTPVLSSSEGTTSGFAIPVSFNGSRLSTLEAYYSDGAGAGPQSWTTYKEYAYAFTVDYSANKVTLTDKFFAEETRGGEIYLKFHFQSGEVLDYHILRNGSTVTSLP